MYNAALMRIHTRWWAHTLLTMAAGCSLSYAILVIIIGVHLDWHKPLVSVLLTSIPVGGCIIIWRLIDRKEKPSASNNVREAARSIGIVLFLVALCVPWHPIWAGMLWPGDFIDIAGGLSTVELQDSGEWIEEWDYLGIYNNAAILCQGGATINPPGKNRYGKIDDTPVQYLGWTWSPAIAADGVVRNDQPAGCIKER